MRKLLLTFTRNMRSVIQLSLPEESQSFFKPSKASKLRLAPLSFSNYSAAICGNVTNLGDDQASILAKALVGFRHAFTRNSTKLFHDGLLRLRPVKMSLRGSLSVVRDSSFAHLDLNTVVEVLSQLADEPCQAQPESFDILCPACQIPKDAAHIVMRPQGKWNSIKCKSCKRQRSSRQWLCSCSVPWHSCPLHAILGHACGGKEKAIRDARKIRMHIFQCHLARMPTCNLMYLLLGLGAPSGVRAP